MAESPGTPGPRPVVVRRKVNKVGNPDAPSFRITLPPEWVEQHNLQPGAELTLIANRDLHIVAPGHEDEVDTLLHNYIRGVTATPKDETKKEK